MSGAAIPFRFPAEPGVVSVVIPTYNRADAVGRAIASALAQTYERVDVIVVDDGSTDATRAVVGAFGERVRYVYQENRGVSQARNTALAVAKGEFVAFLDSDDVWWNWKLDAQVAALRANPSAGLAWTDMRAIDDGGTVVEERFLRTMYAAFSRIDVDATMPVVGRLGDVAPSVPAAFAGAALRVGDLSSAIMLGNLLHTPTVLLRRAWIAEVGGFDSAWGNGGEDYEYYTRLCSAGPVLLIDAPTIEYRVGAADQLSGPARSLHMAQQDLMTLRARVSEPNRIIVLPPNAMRRRLASSLAWVGFASFDAGNRLEAARHLGASLRNRPGVDRRVLILAVCALPASMIETLRRVRGKLRGMPSRRAAS
jgi:GT2 family glycosyltransferase